MGNVHMEATQINYRGGSKKMSVEEAIKAAGTEITPEEKAWIDTIPELASQEIIAPEFDAEAGVYAVGDKVMYEGKLYEFTTAHETPGDWDSSEVSETTVADELNSLESGLTNVTTLISDNDYVNVYRYNSTVHVVLKNGSTQIPNNSLLAEGLPVPKDGTNVYSIMQYYDGTNWQIGIVYVSSIGDIGVMNANSQFLTAGNYIKGELVYLVN